MPEPVTDRGAAMSGATPLDALRTHPAFGIADVLAEYVGVERDLVQFVEFLSLAAGRMVMPVNIDVQTERVAVDLFIANRFLDLRPRHVARVDTHRQFRHLEREGFTLSDGAAGTPYGGPHFQDQNTSIENSLSATP